MSNQIILGTKDGVVRAMHAIIGSRDETINDMVSDGYAPYICNQSDIPLGVDVFGLTLAGLEAHGIRRTIATTRPNGVHTGHGTQDDG
jgi:hypothetical protein